MATEADAEGILSIYAPIIEHTVSSFQTKPPSPAEMRDRIRSLTLTHPWLVSLAKDSEVVSGYAYACPHRARAAYQWSAEVSIYVHPDHHRKGLGRELYRRLLGMLAAQGFVMAYAGIVTPNPGSVGLHQAAGFTLVGVFPDVGYKMGEWQDVSWWSRRLRDLPADPAAPLTVEKSRNLPEWLDCLEGRGPVL